MTEQHLQTKLIKALRMHGAYVVKIVAATHAGVPDVLACVKGRFWAFECKSEKGKLSELQYYNLKNVIDAGGRAEVIREGNYEEVMAALAQELGV
jgi:Holliday junction resolvase